MTLAPLLVSYADAARLLGVGRERLRALIASGHLRAHPVLSDRIRYAELQRFADNGDERHGTTPDTEERRTMDAGAPEGGWQTPSLRVRSHRQ